MVHSKVDVIPAKAPASASLVVVALPGLFFAEYFVSFHHLTKLQRVSFLAIGVKLKRGGE